MIKTDQIVIINCVRIDENSVRTISQIFMWRLMSLTYIKKKYSTGINIRLDDVGLRTKLFSLQIYDWYYAYKTRNSLQIFDQVIYTKDELDFWLSAEIYLY